MRPDNVRLRQGLVGLGMLLVLAAPRIAGAQGRPATIYVGAVAVGPLSGTADRFGIGFGADAGVSFEIKPQMGIRVDWVFGNLGQAGDWPQPPLPVAFDTKLRTQMGTVDFVLSGPPGRAQIYVLAGIGVYYRRVEVTGVAADLVEVCDPWWFVCTDGAVTAARVVGTRSHTSVGVNVGAGVRFGRIFVEGRFHYADGPTFDTPTGKQTATGKFFPVVVGVVF